MRRLVACAAMLLLVGCAAGAPPDPQAGSGVGAVPDPLVVGLVPNVSPDEQRARYEPLATHLEAALGVDVELFVAADYAGVVAAMASERLDLAYFGGLTYAQAARQVDVVPLVTEVDRETGTTDYVSAVVVRAGSGLDDLDDVLARGGTFAMGDVASTSGSLYPRVMLVEAGARCSPDDLTSCEPLEIAFTGGHDAAAQAVLQGRAVAAGIERRILNRLVREKVVPEGALEIVAEQPVPGYPWVARAALGQDAHDAIAGAFLAIDEPGLLDLLRARAYARVGPDDYADLRGRAAELGLLEAGGP